MGTKICVDHNHTTGKIRGLLCHKCNSMLGYIKESPLTLQRAVAYLQYYDNVPTYTDMDFVDLRR